MNSSNNAFSKADDSADNNVRCYPLQMKFTQVINNYWLMLKLLDNVDFKFHILFIIPIWNICAVLLQNASFSRCIQSCINSCRMLQMASENNSYWPFSLSSQLTLCESPYGLQQWRRQTIWNLEIQKDSRYESNNILNGISQSFSYREKCVDYNKSQVRLKWLDTSLKRNTYLLGEYILWWPHIIFKQIYRVTYRCEIHFITLQSKFKFRKKSISILIPLDVLLTAYFLPPFNIFVTTYVGEWLKVQQHLKLLFVYFLFGCKQSGRCYPISYFWNLCCNITVYMLYVFASVIRVKYHFRTSSLWIDQLFITYSFHNFCKHVSIDNKSIKKTAAYF